MTDQTSQFFAILTAVGEAKQANANALGVPWTFSQMGVGDANGTDPTPLRDQTKLINERRRAPLNQVKVDPKNPNMIIAEQVIPPEVGGWWIREIGLYDSAGDLVAVANSAPSFKPLLTQGTGKTQVVRLNIIVTSTANVQLKIDPSVVLATREYVDARVLEEFNKLDSKQSVRVATTVDIALAGLLSIDGVALAVGDRVLVKNQAAAKDNGLYVAALNAWVRSADADTNAEVTSALLVSVEQGATQADTRWQLVTDGLIVLGTTALTFQNVTQGFAPINSPALINPTAVTTPPQFNATKSLATTEFVQRALGSLAGIADIGNGASVNVGHIGKRLNIGDGSSYLPATATVVDGATLHYKNTGNGSHTLHRVGADIISCDGSSLASIVVGQGEELDLVRAGSGWIGSGTAALKYTAAFMSSFYINGYQKLPSGLIIQWGLSGYTGTSADVTFPVVFPNRCAWIGSQDNGGAPNLSMWTFSLAGATGFTAHNIGALSKGTASFLVSMNSGCVWFAIGY